MKIFEIRKSIHISDIRSLWFITRDIPHWGSIPRQKAHTTHRSSILASNEVLPEKREEESWVTSCGRGKGLHANRRTRWIIWRWTEETPEPIATSRSTDNRFLLQSRTTNSVSFVWRGRPTPFWWTLRCALKGSSRPYPRALTGTPSAAAEEEGTIGRKAQMRSTPAVLTTPAERGRVDHRDVPPALVVAAARTAMTRATEA